MIDSARAVRLSYLVPPCLNGGTVAAPAFIAPSYRPTFAVTSTRSVARTSARYTRASVSLKISPLHVERRKEVGQWDKSLFSGVSDVPPVAAHVGQWDMGTKANCRFVVFAGVDAVFMRRSVHIRRWH